MTCEIIRPQLTSLLDNELPANAAAEVRTHLAGCSECAQVYEQYGVILAKASEGPSEELDLWPAISDGIAAADKSALLDELRLMREEMQTLRREMSDLRRQLAARPATAPKSSRLSFPYMPQSLDKPYQIV